jgi:hypothetical protein
MSNIDSLVSDFAAQLTAQIRSSVLADLRSMSIEQLYKLAHGKDAPKAPKVAVVAVAVPVKRGPGRPKKAAAAATPKKPTDKKSKTTSSGRLARRSVGDIQSTLESVVSLLQSYPDGLRSEQIRGALGIDKRELPRVMMEGLTGGHLSKTGQKRSTQYFANHGTKRGRKKG